MPNSNLYQEKNTLRCKFFDKNDGIYHRNAQTPYHRAGDKAFVRERFHDGPKQKAGEKPVVIDAADKRLRSALPAGAFLSLRQCMEVI